mmetsp:Transcript_79542/g.132820  ORF Transcript_79542/g.132820 Transcript_79542/m.132820 type:complete len:229 (+) Transcript_79542:257-943(+)
MGDALQPSGGRKVRQHGPASQPSCSPPGIWGWPGKSRPKGGGGPGRPYDPGRISGLPQGLSRKQFPDESAAGIPFFVGFVPDSNSLLWRAGGPQQGRPERPPKQLPWTPRDPKGQYATYCTAVGRSQGQLPDNRRRLPLNGPSSDGQWFQVKEGRCRKRVLEGRPSLREGSTSPLSRGNSGRGACPINGADRNPQRSPKRNPKRSPKRLRHYCSWGAPRRPVSSGPSN